MTRDNRSPEQYLRIGIEYAELSAFVMRDHRPNVLGCDSLTVRYESNGPGRLKRPKLDRSKLAVFKGLAEANHNRCLETERDYPEILDIVDKPVSEFYQPLIARIQELEPRATDPIEVQHS